MFEIKKDQLQGLTDSQLRELVARLCEAELHKQGIRASAVRWGGAQTTPDGGLDVYCCVETEGFEGGFVPRARTGFQVKKHTMPKSAIRDEMSPKGELRPIFAELASEHGCYVIVSLEDDVPPGGFMLRRRMSAMKLPIEQIKDQESLDLRFYGRGDLANWVRQHPGVQLWVREMLGLPLRGWKPFGRWARTPSGVKDELICKEGIVIRTPDTGSEGLGIAPGIEKLRKLVRAQGKAVRIVGLSGVGKTRIVQALFEEEVGTGVLPKSLAIYADSGEILVPSPSEVIETLAAEQRYAIIVLDNCAFGTHEKLAKLVENEPKIQLVSIEYDIQEDRPEATSVVRVDAKGPEIAEVLILRRYPHLDQANARRVAEFSGGNALLAILLADAVEEQGSLSEFSNRQLFERLFFQRNEPDGDLLVAAEVLALVYSFPIRPDEDGSDELGTLAQILGQDRSKLYRAAQTLVERQLAQVRGRWRAILPHAVANRLAARALRNIDPQEIVAAIQDLSNPRLLMSFGRRLGFLHDHEVAQEIVESWLSPNGILQDISKLDHNHIQLLRNIAPAAPEAVLCALENQARGKSAKEFFQDIYPRGTEIVSLLLAIAYEPDHFERCVNLLTKLSRGDSQGTRQIGNRFSGLFALYLSGTEAPPEMRERVMRQYLESGDHDKQRLGLEMLGGALQSSGWMSVGTNEFGARARTFGYYPSTVAERERWFLRFLALLDELDLQANREFSEELRRCLADELPRLWEYPGIRSAVAALVKRLHARRSWIEGWRAVRHTMTRYWPTGEQGSEVSPALKVLKILDRDLRPRELGEQVRTYVLSMGPSIFSWDDDDFHGNSGSEKRSFDRGARKAHFLGKAVAADPSVITALSEEFFISPGTYAYEFGKGLAEQTENTNGLLNRLVPSLELAGERAQQCQVLIGVLQVAHQRNGRDAEAFLDAAVENTILRRFIVDLQRSIPFSQASSGRLLQALSHADTPARQFAILGWLPDSEELTEKDVERIMLTLLERTDGPEVVLESMSRRVDMAEEGEATFGIRAMQISLLASSQLLRRGTDAIRDQMTYHYLSIVLKKSINEDEIDEQIVELLDALSASLRQSHGYLGNLGEAVGVIAEKTTDRFLNGFFLDSGLQDHEREQVFRERRMGNPLSGIGASKLLDWCRQGDFERRLVILAGAICPFGKGSEEGELRLTEQAQSLVEAASMPNAILEAYALEFNPPYWTGNLSEAFKSQRKALRVLLEHDRADIRGAAKALVERIRHEERKRRQWERDEDQRRRRRFE